MSEEDVNDVIDAVLFCVEDQAVLKAVLAGKPWSKALGGDTGGTWERGYWSASAYGIKVMENGHLVKHVKPGEIVKRAKDRSATLCNSSPAPPSPPG